MSLFYHVTDSICISWHPILHIYFTHHYSTYTVKLTVLKYVQKNGVKRIALLWNKTLEYVWHFLIKVIRWSIYKHYKTDKSVD